jgi:hypothetical protein
MTLIRPNSGIPNSTTFPDIVDTQTSVIPPYYPKTVEFEIKVTDQTVQDAQPACVTIDPVDGADNHLCNGRYQWCFPVVVDDLPPTILGANPTHSKLDVTINDNRTNDRGVGEVKIENVINFQSPYLVKPYDSVYSGTHSATLTLNVITKGKSAYARIWTIDSFGLRTNHILNHTDSADVWIYAQDLRLSHTPIILTPGTFYDSVYLTWTDSIPLSQKNLTQYNFGFQLVQLEGTPQVNFLGASTAGTLSQGWTVTPVTAPNRSYTITGISNGPALPDMPTAAQMAAKPLLILQFDAQASSSPGETILRINGTPGSEVAYNGGADSLYSGTNYSVTLAAPYGTLSGETLVAKGDCSPLVGVGGTPTEISLAPTTPNPAATSALVDYTVPAEGLVRLELYNTLGARIRTLVEQVQKQGEYRLDLLAGDLPQGTYFLRLESGGKVVSRQVVLGR